jgi:Zn-dependent protease with chaperone function
MIAPLQVIILLLIAAAYSSAPQRPPIALSPEMVIALVVLVHGALLVTARRRFQRIGRKIKIQSISLADAGAAIHSRVQKFMALNTMLLAVDLWILGLGWLVKFHWNMGRYPVLSSVIWMVAPVLTWLAIWFLEYPLEEIIHRQTELPQASAGYPIHELPARGQYVHMQFKHGLSLLVVLLAFDLLTVPFSALTQSLNLGNWSAVASVLPALILLMLLPLLVVRYWRTVRLPDGPLRTRLEDLSHRKKVGFMDIRIWNTYYRIPNAAILGLLPWCRYFLLTDLLLERLDAQQVEAVFAHEVGHGFYRHVWWYLLTFFAADLLSTGISLWIGNNWSLSNNGIMLLNFTIVGALLVFGFSRVSRLCEHQADWFAAQHIADRIAATAPVMPLLIPGRDERVAHQRSVASGPYIALGCAGNQHAEQTPVGAGACTFSQDSGNAMDSGIIPLEHGVTADNAALMETPAQAGARIFSESLITLVGMSRRPRDRAGWMHPSTESRVDLLAALAVSPELRRRFNRRIFIMRLVIMIAATAGAALTIWAAHP